tara:strand:- start:1258 stop:1635 length:378 start_codon:yes stop_codon:yes gene_type:complete
LATSRNSLFLQLLVVTEIEMHKMNEIDNGSAARTADNGRLYIESLLAVYPAVTEQDRLAILSFLSTAPALETALLTCNERIAERLKAFRHDHRKQLGVTMRNWLYLAILLSFVVFAVLLMSEAGN